jgi:Short C-terminal domain
MPRLLRGMARTAAVAGTATVVSGGVRRRQEARWAQKEGQQQAAEQQAPPPAAPVAAAAPAPAAPSMIDQLKELGELKSQGILTEEEFAAQKAKLLGAGS